VRQNLIEEIRRNRKLMNINEADIEGVDELVYNPATKSGGDIGHGYDRGTRINGITWSGHEDHLHLGFTDRDVAMKVIDKADQMGLRTTENPYAKKDPNGKVDNVHTTGSFHYKEFPGEPKVGGGVDISGDEDKIVELIKWVEDEYAHGNYKIDYDTNDDGEDLLSKVLNYKIGDSSLKDLISKAGTGITDLLSKLF
jgi:hypothetical protein